MDTAKILNETKSKFDLAVSHFELELKKVRTGRANASMLEGVVAEVYGTQMPLNQVASIMAPEAQLLQITPFDPTNLQAINNAIRSNPNLGLNPSDDGKVIRVPIPPLTEERRRDLVKQLGQRVEDTMIVIRNIRHESLDAVNRAKKDKQIGEDDASRLQKQIDDLVSQCRLRIDDMTKTKEKEILTV